MLRACRRFSTARLAGWATVEGTDRYSQRSRRVEASHFRVMMPQGIETTSLGIGTYTGPADSETDELMHNAIVTSVRSGTVNHIDTAINYRYQKSERCVGRALRSLAEEGVQREEYIVASKVGFVPDDADTNEEGSALVQQLTSQGKVPSEDFVQGHCLHPAFLQDQLERSLQNLGLETLDVLYLHNPAEAQLQKLGKQKFMDRLAKAFEFCESARTSNKLKYFGLATWKCFRTPETDEGMHLSLESVMDLAEKVGGARHGLHFVQLPINVAMPEAFIFKWQPLEGAQELFLNVAKRLKVNVIVSSPLLQGRAVDVKLSKMMLGVEPQGARHVQMLRSIPSSSIKCVLVGMKNPDHVLMNTQVAYVDPMVPENFLSYLKPEGLMDVKVTTKLW